MQPQPSDHDLFDTLCILRDNYAMPGMADREVSLSVDAAVVYGEGLMRIARRRDEHASRRDPATKEWPLTPGAGPPPRPRRAPGRLLRLALAEDQPDRRAEEAVRVADPVLEVAPVTEVHERRVVDEDRRTSAARPPTWVA